VCKSLIFDSRGACRSLVERDSIAFQVLEVVESKNSSGLPVVVFRQPAKPFTTRNRALTPDYS
jgi:hypothetical protein